MLTLTLPISLMVSKKKRYPLNLNDYRIAHFRENHKGKELFENMVKSQVLRLPTFKKVLLVYKIIPQRMSDISNIGSIVDKFFCDSLVKYGRIPDDNSNIVSGVLFFFGGVDPKNPRAEVTICPISEMELDLMKITIDQSEIETAIKDYIAKRVTLNPDQEISIGLAATRGATGFTAEIEITAKDQVNLLDANLVAEPVPENAAPVVPARRPYTRKAAEAPVEIPAEDLVEEALEGTVTNGDVIDSEEPVEAESSSALADVEEAVQAAERPKVLFGKKS